MKINRPLLPHLSIYKPQLTSILSIFHRISGAFLAIMVFSSILFSKIGDLNPTSYYLYRYAFFFTFYFYWLISSIVNFSFLALCYHVSNGIRHLLWDLDFFLELSKVYTSEIIILFYAIFLVVSNIIRFYFS